MSVKSDEMSPPPIVLSSSKDKRMIEGHDSARRGSISDAIAYVTGLNIGGDGGGGGSGGGNSPGGSLQDSTHGSGLRRSVLNARAYISGTANVSGRDSPPGSLQNSTHGSGLRQSVLNARAYITGTANDSGRNSPNVSVANFSSSKNVLKNVTSLLFSKSTTVDRRPSAIVGSSMKSPNLSAREENKVERDVYHRRQARFSTTELALHAVIINPIGIGYFLAFCEAEHQIEYINFFLQVEEYKALTGVNSIFVGQSLPSSRGNADDEKSSDDLLPSWMAIDEKIFNTSSDNLLVASSDLVHNRASSNAIYRRMSQQNSIDNDMIDMHPTAVKICHIFLSERAFAMRMTFPVPPEEEVEQKVKQRAPSLSSKSTLPIRNIFTKSGGGSVGGVGGGSVGGGGFSSAKESIASMLSPRNHHYHLMNPDDHVSIEDDNDGGIILPLMAREEIPYSNDTRNPIYLSKRVASNTKLRLEHSNYYGAEVFSEAALEVFRYIAQDIYPRFLNSTWYERMKKHGKLVTDVVRGHDLSHLLPRANTLRIRPPESKILESVASGGGSSSLDQAFADAAASAAGGGGGGGGGGSHRRSTSQGPRSQPKFFTVEDIICDGILYNEFLQRLKQTSNTEYLLCLRSINIFKDIINPPPPKPQNTTRRNITRQRSIALGGGGSSSKIEKKSKASSSSRASFSDAPPAPGDERRSLRLSFQRSSIVESSDQKDREIQQEAERKAQKMEDQAWLIYTFFVAKGSALEITLLQKHREDIMKQLATPTLHMFDHLEIAAKTQLEFIFTNYKRVNQESYVTWESRAIIVAQNILNIETGTKNTRWKREVYKKIAVLRRIFKRKLRKVFIF